MRQESFISLQTLQTTSLLDSNNATTRPTTTLDSSSRLARDYHINDAPHGHAHANHRPTRRSNTQQSHQILKITTTSHICSQMIPWTPKTTQIDNKLLAENVPLILPPHRQRFNRRINPHSHNFRRKTQHPYNIYAQKEFGATYKRLNPQSAPSDTSTAEPE
jgi:hypothetical protein